MSDRNMLVLAWLIVTLIVGSAVPHAPAQQPATQPGAGGGPLTVALLPPVNRAAPAHPGIADAIVTITGSEIAVTRRAVMVSRDHLGRLYTDKELAAVGLSDRPELAQRGRMIPADVQVFIYYGVAGDRLNIHADLIPSERSDVNAVFNEIDRDFVHLQVDGTVADRAAVIQRFAAMLIDHLPRRREPSTAVQPVHHALGADDTVAVFTPTAAPTTAELSGAATVSALKLRRAFADAAGCAVVDREQIDAVLREHHMKLAGLLEREREFATGRLLGADCIVVGSLTQDTSRVRVDMHLLDVATGTLLAHATASVDDPASDDVARRLTRRLIERAAAGRAMASWLLAHRPVDHTEGASLSRRARDVYYSYYTDDEDQDIKPRVRRLMDLALELSPDHVDVHANLAYIYTGSGHHERSRHHHQRVVELDPGNNMHWHEYGRFLLSDHVVGGDEQPPATLLLVVRGLPCGHGALGAGSDRCTPWRYR